MADLNWYIGGNGLTHGYLPDAIEGITKPYPYIAWRVEWPVNDGMPFHMFLPLPTQLTLNRVFQRDYITIYDSLSPLETFETHGLAVLSPTKCEITEEYQGKWTLTLEHPRDVDGKHKHIKPFNIIKAMGQLFSIVSVSNKIPGIITAKAEHIFYHLNDRWIFPGARIISTSVSGLMLSAKLASSDFSTENQISHDFKFASDIDRLDLGVKSNAKWGYTQEGMSLAEFVLGAGNLLDMSGGELYRDNFYYSIYERMENSNDNAFEIRVGKDLTGIKRTVDTSRLCTYFRVYNGLDSSRGTWFAVSYTDVAVDAVAPHSIIRSKTFTPQIPFWITDEDAIAIAADELVAEEGMRFFRENGTPDIKYEISIADINGNSDFAELSNLPDYRVGNIGTIYDERLGVEAKIKITKTVKDAITGNTISVVFGELIGETKIVESVKSLKTADGETLYTADGEALQTRE
jgi:phage minor structural protein